VRCGRGEYDGSALNDMTGTPHPLSSVRISSEAAPPLRGSELGMS
jgi:hypothetical protein